jgi:gliding motility-associated-like protein
MVLNGRLFYTTRFVSFLTSFLLFFVSTGIFAQPAVVTQPSDTSICIQSSAYFSIVAVNTSAYQWQENDGVGWYDLTDAFTYVEGQYTPNLGINDANLGLNGYMYRCVVSDLNNATDTSDAAILNVYEPPIITMDPVNEQVCKNDIGLFSVEAINGTYFQWQENSGIGWISLSDNTFYTGTQTADLSIFTTTGMNGFKYRCIVTHVSCPDTSAYAELQVNPTPIVYTINGGGDFCEGDIGVEIGLDDSEPGISYDLVKDGEQTGIVVQGNGSAISFGNISSSGNYTATAYNQFTGCTISMASSVNVLSNPLPLDFPVQGGGSLCEGEAGADIFMLSSETGIEYQLFRNGNPTGTTVTGTGFTISFGYHTLGGFYTVLATNPATSCSAQMSGSAQIIVNQIPIADAGDDSFITEGNTVQLNGSASNGSGNFNYEWLPAAKCITPASASTQTIGLYNSSLFSFRVYDIQTNCFSQADTTVVYVNSGPLSIQTYSDKNNICVGGSIQLMALPAGGTGNYNYLWTSSPPGFSSTAQNPNITPSVSTIYNLEVFDGQTTVYDSVSIFIKPLPTAFTLQGGGNFCANSEGPEIKLNNSSTETTYYLYNNGNQVSDKFGTGQELNFGNYDIPGNYTARAVNNTTGCTIEQSGIVNITKNDLPIAEAGPNDYILSGENATFTGSASGGSGSYIYSWTPADSLLNPNVAQPSTKALYSTNVFHLKVSDDNNCESAEDNVIAFVAGGELNLQILTSGFPVCAGGDVQLFALVSGGSGSFTYVWQSDPVGFSSSLFNPIVNPIAPTWFKVIATDGIQTISDSIYISVNPNPLSINILGGGNYCDGSTAPEIYLQASELYTSYRLLLNGNNTNTILEGNGQGLNFGQQSQSGEYTVRAVNSYTLCASDMSGSAIVVQNPRPIVDAGLDKTIVQGTSSSLMAETSNGSGNYSYLWQPSELVQSPNNQNTITNNIYQPTTFSIRLTDVQTGCISNIDSVDIYTSGGNLYTFASAGKGTLCPGQSTQLAATAGGGTGNYTYNWTSSPQGIYSNEQNIIVQPDVNTSFYLSVFDGVSQAFDTVEIVIANNPLVFNISGGGDYCQGEDGKNIGLSSSQSGVSYDLFKEGNSSPKTSVIGSGSTIGFGKFTNDGIYYAVATNQYSCSKQMSSSASIHKNLPPKANAGEDKSVNFNSSTVLNGNGIGGSGEYNYLWSPADSLVNANSKDALTKNLNKTTLFNLEITDAQTSCAGGESDEVIVFVEGGPLSLEIASSKQAVCADEEFQLFALASGGSGNYTYNWSSAPEGFYSNQYNPIASQTSDRVYYVTLNDGIESLSAQIHINVNAQPTKFTLGGAGEYCGDEEINDIKLQSSEIGISYELFSNNLTTNNILNGTGNVLNFGQNKLEGTYKVVATNDYTGCSSEMKNTITLTFNENPIVEPNPNQTVYSGEQAALNVVADGGSGNYSFLWSPSYLCQNPQNQSTLTVNLNLTTEFGIEATDLLTMCKSNQAKTIVFVAGGDLFASAGTSSGKICVSDSAILNAIASGGTGNYSYSWTSMPVSFVSNQQNPVVKPSQNTTYFLDVYDGVQHYFDTLSIQVSPKPKIYNIIGGGDYCAGNEGKEIKLAASQTGVEYSLFRNNSELISTLSGTGTLLNFGKQTTEGNFSVTAVGNSGCSQNMSGQLSISSLQLPISEAGSDKSISFGGQTGLDGGGKGGSGYYDYFWQPADSLTFAQTKNPLTKPLHLTNIFNLQISDAQTGCNGIQDDNEVVFVSGGVLRLDILSSKSSVCPGEEFQLFGLATGGSGNYSYVWTAEPAGFTSTVYDPVLNQDQTTTYTLSLSDGIDIISKSIQVTTNELPTAFTLSGGGNYCPGDFPDEISLSASQINIDYQLLLDEIPTEIIKQGSGFALNFGFRTEEGNYTVVATNTQTACVNDMAGTVNVSLNEIPIADAGPDQIVFAGTNAVLQGTANSGSGSYSYSWTPANMVQNPDNQNTQTIILNKSNLFVLNVSDLQSMCPAVEDSTFVYIKGGDLSVTTESTNSSICEGEQISLLGLASGGTGNFIYKWTSSPEGFYSNIFNPSATPVQNTIYILQVFDGIQYAYDSLEIIVNTLPQSFDVYGGGQYCKGLTGIEIGLVGSETGTDYTLFQSPDYEVNTISGSGQPISFGYLSEEGNYFVVASKNQACFKNMNGEAFIQQNPLPIADAGQDLSVEYGNQLTLNGNASAGSGTYNFIWSPSDSLVNNFSQNPLTLPMHSTTVFNLAVSDANTGCSNAQNDEMVAFVSGGPFISHTTVSENLICEGDEIQLSCLASGGSGNYTYLWESVPSGFSSTVYNPNDIPPVSRVYYISISDGNSIITDSVAVNVNPAPTVYNLLGGGEFCANENGKEISLSNSESGVSYSLFNSAGYTGISVVGNNSAISFGTLDEPGEYFATAENILSSCNSDMANSITLIKNDVPIALAGPDKSIVSGESTQLSGNASGGSGSYIYSWAPDYLLVDNSLQNPTTLSLSNSNTFLLNVSDAQTSCISNTDSTIVYVTGGPLTVNANASSTDICKGEAINLNALAGGGDGNYSYVWSSSPQGFESQIANPSVIPENSIWYIIKTTDGDLTATDSIFINVNARPQYFELNGGGEICEGENGLDISLSGSENQTVYQLFRNNSFLISEKIGGGNPIDFGEFKVSGTYTAKAYKIESNCSSSMIGSAVIIQHPLATADAGPDKIINPGGNATLNGSATNGSGSYIYKWIPTDKLLNPNDQNPSTVDLYQSTLYNLQVIDQISGCQSEESSAIVFVTGSLPLSVEILSQSPAVCPGEQSSLIAIPTGGTGNYSYYWRSNPTGFISSENEITVNPGINTWYILQLSDGITIIKDSVQLNTLPIPTIYSMSGGGGYCPEEQGLNVYIDQSQTGVNYSLYFNVEPTGIIMAGDGSKLNFGRMVAEGNYSVRAKAQNGCVSLMQNSVQIEKYQKPFKYQLYGGGTYCDNDPALGLLLESSQKNVDYELYRDAISTGQIKTGTGLPISFVDLQGNGLFTVSATNSLTGCFENMNGIAPLIINQSPNISISGNNEICKGDSTVLNASGGISYLWNTVPPSEDPAIKVSPQISTTYSVISSNNSGCSSVDSIRVKVNEKPDIYLENDLLSFSIICNPAGYQNYDFYHGNDLIQSGVSNILMYADLSLSADTIRVIATNASNCSDMASIYLEIADIPNAFSPDGDGKNEKFLVGRDIKVFSRWGKEIYNGTEGWDGFYKGKLVSPGTYYYILFIHNSEGEVVNTKKGSVTVVIY